MVATIVPYDHRTASEDLGCADGYKRIEHRVQITFTGPGEATIRVHGRKIVGEEFSQQGEPIEVEKRVHVR
ncbi:MAG TPA: hypothetical protein VK399_13465 [Longimicrobiaceae bacterium]|jgi:hypothetical protein|nr:hypothetical protein [Longimicrobiaceae bacterium]